MNSLPEPSELWIALMIGLLLLVGAIAVLASAIGRWMSRAATQPPSAEEQADDEHSLDSVRARLAACDTDDSELARTSSSALARRWGPLP